MVKIQIVDKYGNITYEGEHRVTYWAETMHQYATISFMPVLNYGDRMILEPIKPHGNPSNT